MVHVRHDYCEQMQRRCIKSEYDKSNHITICHAFAEGDNQCEGERHPVDVCIDRYEFPNQRGEHPPVMVDFFDGERACQAQGKRLCLEREWVSACEGPKEKPFPYGWQRSSEHCNIDNRWIEPSLARIYSKREDVRDKELTRLNQSVPSGSRPGCVSDFGVFDLTGNFDEWVRLDQPKPKARSQMAGLKGGAWGHVRNACRPITTSHAPEFTYYFISFRCCKDVARQNVVNEPSTPEGASCHSQSSSRLSGSRPRNSEKPISGYALCSVRADGCRAESTFSAQ
jgi:formylglycine-generating enzyme required for sulfatase activity